MRKEIGLPTYILKDRSVSVLEAIVEYLKSNENLSFHEIALLINRDDRTIWTVYDRVKKKRGKKKWEIMRLKEI